MRTLRRFRITHPSHPQHGHEFDLIQVKLRWGIDRVYHTGEDGALRHVPVGWTDVSAVDPFVAVARRPIDDKPRILREHGCLNARPEDVRDELFLANAFFDPRDLLQVKYEMLRRVREDGESVSAAAARFGLSRPTFYSAQRAYEAAGPRRAHKLGAEVVEALRAASRQRPPPSSRELLELVRERFGLSVHRRSIERVLARQKKRP